MIYFVWYHPSINTIEILNEKSNLQFSVDVSFNFTKDESLPILLGIL